MKRTASPYKFVRLSCAFRTASAKASNVKRISISKTMKTNILAALAIAALVGVAGCKEKTTAEKAGDAVKDAAEKTGDAVEKGAKKTGEALEKAGDKVKDAAK
jgi:hypothetical protein